MTSLRIGKERQKSFSITGNFSRIVNGKKRQQSREFEDYKGFGAQFASQLDKQLPWSRATLSPATFLA
jgi:hypothetical protein